jgi:hypothetical protein
MTTGNKLGVLGIVSLVMSQLLIAFNSRWDHTILMVSGGLLELATLLLFLTAGVKGSRWWFLAPVLLVGMFLFIVSHGV